VYFYIKINEGILATFTNTGILNWKIRFREFSLLAYWERVFQFQIYIYRKNKSINTGINSKYLQE